jgi:integrase
MQSSPVVLQSVQKNKTGQAAPLRLHRPNGHPRQREYLTQSEIDKLITAANGSHSGHRDSTMVLVAFRHGLRPSELVGLRWKQINLTSGTLHVRRAKQGTPATHRIPGDELRALRQLRREHSLRSSFLFVSNRGEPFTVFGFAKILERAGIRANLKFKVHPAMLRHSCGLNLASEGHDALAVQMYLGHKCGRFARQYTRLKNIWRSRDSCNAP